MSYTLKYDCKIVEQILNWLNSINPGEYLEFTVSNRNSHHGFANYGGDPQINYVVYESVALEKSPKIISIFDLLKSVSYLASIESIQMVPQANQQAISKSNLSRSENKNRQSDFQVANNSLVQIDHENDELNNIEVVLRKRAKPLAQIKTPSVHDLVVRALRLYAAKEYESVLDILVRYSWIAAQSADILNAAGASAFALKFPQWAISLYRSAVEIMPGHYDAWNNLGIALSEIGNLYEAESAHRKAIELRPQELSFHADLVRVLSRTERTNEAYEICIGVLEKNPGNTLLLGELGNICIRQGEFLKAREQYAKILQQIPRDEAIALKCAAKLAHAGFWGDAETIHRKAIDTNQSDMARFHLSLLLLVQGRFEEGWMHYEARSVVRKNDLPQYPFPVWKGESIVGKSVLISFEQGFGDEIMMARYASELKKAGALRVGMVCRRPLVPLFKTLDEVEMLTPEEGEPVVSLQDHQYDFWTLPFEIPRYLKTDLGTIPANVPYLKALPERKKKWATVIARALADYESINQCKPMKVGLVWKGSTLHGADTERSLSNLESLAPLWKVKGIQFFSLQKGLGEDELEGLPKNQPIVDLGSSITDFGDTAAIVEQMDLIVSVDTAVVHMAGALNRPCWVLIPYFATDWRWMLDREDSPWYPSLKLFRQDFSGNWRETITQVQHELASLMARRKSQPLLARH